MDEIDEAALPEAGIAIIGLAGQFPGAPDVETFWQNLCAGVELIRAFSDDELIASGVDPALLANPNYVKAGAVLDDITGFDAALLRHDPPRGPDSWIPQQRLFLESAWAALEDAGYRPRHLCRPHRRLRRGHASSYLLNNLVPHRRPGGRPSASTDYSGQRQGLPRHARRLQAEPARPGADRADRLLHLARRRAPGLPGLLSGECDMALAGGVSHRACRRAPATSTRRAASSRRTATAAPSTPRPRAPSPAAAWAWWCSSGWPTRWRTATTSTPSSAARPSTTTARTRSASPRPASSGQAEVIAEAQAVAGVDARDHRLRRGARHRHRAGRPDRGRGAHQGLPRRHRRDAASAPSARSRPTSATWTPRPASPG